MIETIKMLWSPGMSGNSVRLRRQVALCNQVSIFGIAATTPYQLFYLLYDFAIYRDVFMANLVFMKAYGAVLICNYQRWHNAASNVLLVNGCTQLFVVTYFISAEAGVNLFYFTFAAVLCFLYQHLPKGLYSGIMASLGVLYLLTHFLFTPHTAVAPVPSPWVEIMYAFSVAGVLILSGTLLYLFRQQIDQAEEELTLNNVYLETLSHTDPLTGLANRRALDAALEQERSRLSRHPGELAVIMCDVDHFKKFNDHYGHDAGDRCLQQVAETLRGVLARPADLAVRYGGEEFALLLPGTGELGARRLGEKAREAIERQQIPNAAAGRGASVTVSVGVSSLDRASPQALTRGIEPLLKRADQALYRAKASGRNRVEYLDDQGSSDADDEAVDTLRVPPGARSAG
ncbi:GGDEF domain-containing protein [Salinicola avicenniae]|uniref:GGDEF domain-containing protein n=1 Tax=Salinicola avicenniae TaxID=2916836 RepID=UPI00207375D3|nr:MULTISPECIES: GGDEF domain-containing protein [unclassified Salinicola]